MYLSLFITFFKIGLFSFGGGYAALPLIQQEVVGVNQWISASEFNDLITISQMTPGPIAINASTFVGTRLLGLPGGIVATLGCVTPSAIIVGLLAYFYSKYKNIDAISNVLVFLRPAIISMILIAGVDILNTALFENMPISISNINIPMLVIFGVSLAIMVKKEIDPIKMMLASGVVYLLVSFII